MKITFPLRSINIDAEVVGLKCDIGHPPGLESLSLVLSWFHNQDPTPFLIWRLQDPHPETFGRLVQLQDVHLTVVRSSKRTNTHLHMLNTNLMFSGIIHNALIYVPNKGYPLQGTFTCMIHNQGNPEEYDAKSGNMIVYKPPEMSSLQQV